MKKFWALTLLLLSGCSGCYSENKAIVEGGRPVEIHLKGMDHALKIAIPEIDGCDYCFAYNPHNRSGGITRVFHYEKCQNCEKRTWPDGKKPMDKVDVRDLGEFHIYPLEIDGHEYFTVGGWNCYPDDIIHRGHCKTCAKKRF
jgi:hypothetical protein